MTARRAIDVTEMLAHLEAMIRIADVLSEGHYLPSIKRLRDAAAKYAETVREALEP